MSQISFSLKDENKKEDKKEDEILNLLSRNTQEQIGLNELLPILKEERKINGYWGTAPTKLPSIAYLIPILKIKDMINAGINMTIFIADLHAFLDKGGSIDKIEMTNYYIFLISTILKNLGINENQYKFKIGNTIQFNENYIKNLLKLMTCVTIEQAKKAGSEVVKQEKNQSLGSLVYPLMQIIDEIALEADIELGGIDQRKIFMASRDHSEKIGKKKCSYIMNPLLSSLSKPKNNEKDSFVKMSSSDPNGKINFTDTFEVIETKIKKAYCVEKEIYNNPCIDLVRLIIYPMNQKILNIDSYEKFEEEWKNSKINAKTLKEELTRSIDKIIDPIRETILKNKTFHNLIFSQ